MKADTREKQGMGRKPSRSAEQREVHFLEPGAAISRRACSKDSTYTVH